MRTALYTRISQDSTGERAGVTRQLEDCEALADRLGWEVVAPRYDDNDLSAFSGKTRPGFEAMLDAMKRGEFDAIICWHPDRLYRSMKDLERLIDIADERGVQLRTVNGGDLDLSNSTGKMIARILGSVSRQESEHKGERRRRANAQRATNGAWRADGPRIFGYTQRGEPLEPEAPAVSQAAADVLGGRSLRSIATDWNSRALLTARGKQWSNLTLRRMLMNPTYAGLRTYRGKVIGPGDWAALIDAETHHGLVAFLTDSSRRPATSFERRHQGSGVYLCGKCGHAMYATVPHGSDRITYMCRRNFHLARLGAPLDAYVEMVVLKYLRGTDIHLLLQDGRKVDVGGLQTQRAALQARADDLAAMFAEGAIDGSQLRRGTSELRTQLAGIDNQLAELARRNPVADLLDTGEAIEKRWAALSADMRGKIVNELMTVTVLPTPRGVKGVTIDRDTGVRIINPQFVRIDWKS
jgi:site-specific DNA recombinase